MEKTYNENLQNMQYDHNIAMQKITIQYKNDISELNKNIALLEQELQMTKNNFEKELS